MKKRNKSSPIPIRISLRYFLSEGLKNCWRNRLANVLAIGIMAVSLYILGVFLLLSDNLSRVVGYWRENAVMTVFLVRDVSPESVKALQYRLEANFVVASAHFVSADSAREAFSRHFPGLLPPNLIFKQNPFPASFEVRIQENYAVSGQLEKFIDGIERIDTVEEIQYDRNWVENLAAVIKIVRILILFLGITLLAASVSTISNVIRLTVYYRKEEIEVMRLVGAEQNFIRGPFVVEGMVQGALGALFALSLLLLSHRIFLYYIMRAPNLLLRGLAPHFLPPWYVLAYILGGLFLGLVGSLFCLRKYAVH